MDKEASGYTCYWRIENFILFKEGTDFYLRSPIFRANMLYSCFRLDIEDCERTYLAIYLSKVFKPNFFDMHRKQVVFLDYSVSLLTKSGWITVADNVRHKFRIDDSSWSEDKLVSWEKLEKEKWEYLPNGCLTVKFHIWNDDTRNTRHSAQCLILSRMLNEKKISTLPLQTFYKLKPGDLLYFPSSYEFKQCSTEANETQTDIPGDEHGLHDQGDILKLFQEKKLDFATLKTSEKEFMVHKAVLSAFSPVFKAMFDQSMQENVQNVVKIDDIDSETMTSIIHSLHLEPLQDLGWEETVKLYCASDKYQIESLRSTCVSSLAKEFSQQNICEAFILADLHQDADLKGRALNYFVHNSKIIFRSSEWKDFLRSNTVLAAEILHSSADELYQM